MQGMSFDGYARTVADFDYRVRSRDVPHDVAELMALSERIELEDKIIVDVEDYRE